MDVTVVRRRCDMLSISGLVDNNDTTFANNWSGSGDAITASIRELASGSR